MTPIEIHARLAELHQEIADLHRQLVQTATPTCGTLVETKCELDQLLPHPATPPAPEPIDVMAAPVVQDTTPAPAQTFTFKTTTRGCTVILEDGASLFVPPGRVEQLEAMLDRGLERFIGPPCVMDYLSSGRHRLRQLKPAKRPRTLKNGHLMVLVRANHAEIGTGEDRLTLTHEAGRKLRDHLEHYAKLRADKREKARRRAWARDVAHAQARVAAQVAARETEGVTRH